jgi:hypothetical protein
MARWELWLLLIECKGSRLLRSRKVLRAVADERKAVEHSDCGAHRVRRRPHNMPHSLFYE